LSAEDVHAAMQYAAELLRAAGLAAHVLAVLGALVPRLQGVDLAGRLWIVEETRIRERT